MNGSDANAHRRPPRGWLIASLVAFPYFFSSLVVVLNSIGNATGVVWLPSFPSWYYQLFGQAGLFYWPFRPYFALLSPVQANPAVSYTAYAFISRAPFLILPLAIFGITLSRWLRARGNSRGNSRRRRLPVSRIGGRGAFLLALAVAAALYVLVPPLRQTVNTGIAALDPRDLTRLRDYLLGFGPLAPAVSFLLMVVQSVAAPLPAFVITLANGLLFGAFWGGLLSWSSAMVGAALCFGIARALGRPVVERLVGAGPLAKTDAFFERYGTHAVLITRLIPIISFDVVSYAAGLTPIRLVPFLIATGIGQLPATVAYSILGENITSGSKVALWAIGAIVSLMVLGFAAKRRVDRQLSPRRVLPDPASSM